MLVDYSCTAPTGRGEFQSYGVKQDPRKSSMCAGSAGRNAVQAGRSGSFSLKWVCVKVPCVEMAAGLCL